MTSPTPTLVESDDMVELKFVNSDARPKITAVRCDAASVPPIMAWYGAYYAGDRYAVFADDQKVAKDQNGELATDLPHIQPPIDGVKLG